MPMKRQANFKVACMAIGFVALLIAASGLYWSNVVRPVLQDDMQALASSMASARANELSTKLGQGTHTDKDINDALESMLAYTYERNQKQFFVALNLELSEDFQANNSLNNNTFQLGESQCDYCFSRDYPMYSTKNFRLIGVLSVSMSNTQADAYINSVQRLFVTGAAVVLVSSIIILIVIWNMTAAMDRLNMSLEEEVAQRTQSLSNEVEEHAKTQKRLHVARDEMQRLERSRIAKTLHDGVGQVLQALRLGLQRLSVQIDDNNKQLVDELVGDTGEAISIIRDFCSELRPLHLERMSLEQALYSHIERLNRRIPNMKLTMQEIGDCGFELSEIVKEQMFLIASELLNNSVKHSDASNVKLIVEWTKSYLILIVTDDGKGIEKGTPKSEGLGLSLITERCERIGAVLQTSSYQGQGVTARCELELNKDKKNDNKTIIS